MSSQLSCGGQGERFPARRLALPIWGRAPCLPDAHGGSFLSTLGLQVRPFSRSQASVHHCLPATALM